MQTLILAIWAVLGAPAWCVDLPVYCRLFQVGLESATYNPILDDVNLSMVVAAPLLGDVDVSISRIEVASVKVASCGASIDEHGIFNVGFQRLDINLQKLAWQYTQRRWPHTYDYGSAHGNTTASFNVSIDMNTQEDHLFKFHIDGVDVDLGAQHHPWLTSALVKITDEVLPLISMVVHHEAQKVMDKSLSVVRDQGSCAFVQNMLTAVDFATFSFTSWQPSTVHVPLVGDVEVSVNSTYIHQPTSMQCHHVGFTGQRLEVHIENVPFDAGFKWGYQKPASSFWHNNGTGTASVVAGTKLSIDLLEPTATSLKIDLPVLDLRLDAEYDKWLYNALTSTMVPLIREALQLFGGRFLARAIEKCLEDPTCPHITPKKKLPAATSYVPVLV